MSCAMMATTGVETIFCLLPVQSGVDDLPARLIRGCKDDPHRADKLAQTSRCRKKAVQGRLVSTGLSRNALCVRASVKSCAITCSSIICWLVIVLSSFTYSGGESQRARCFGTSMIDFSITVCGEIDMAFARHGDPVTLGGRLAVNRHFAFRDQKIGR